MHCTTSCTISKHALLHAHPPAKPLPLLLSFFLLFFLKHSNGQNITTPAQQHSQQSLLYMYTHLRTSVARQRRTITSQPGSTRLPPRLALPFKCLPPHFLRMRSRHACARASPPLPQSGMLSGGEEEKKQRSLL